MTHFMHQALVFIGAAVMLVPLFHFLGLGSVLGYLIAGMALGPHALQFIEQPADVLHFAELGVVFLLFMIGLEIRPAKLWDMRRSLAGLGLGQILVCGLAFAGLAAALAPDLSPVDAAIVGFALALSSTAFALQTLQSKNQLNTVFGQSSFAVLLAQDLVAIPALALLPVLLGNGGGDAGWGTFGFFLLIVVGLVFASRYLVRPLFRLMAHTHSQELFTATALLIVMGVASIMLGIGLSAGLGAFIAGVLLADSEYRHQLEATLGPFKGLLMGLFFISVGLNVDLALIFAYPAKVVGAALGYLILKALLVYGVGRATRLGHLNSKAMAVNIGQGGEFAFVLFGVAAGAGGPLGAELPFLTAVVTLSMALSPLLTYASDRFSRACPRVEVAPSWDVIPDESPAIIIAGMGRFGQIFGRFLRAQGVAFTAIEHDAGQVELLRRFGNKAYYGDAASAELLEAAGIARARFLVVAVDDPQVSLKIAELARGHFPHLRIFARARNRDHAHELMELGVRDVKRETFDSALNFVGELAVAMGTPSEKVAAQVERFRQHDELMLQEQFKVRGDDEMFLSVSQRGQAQLEDVLNADSTRSYIQVPPP